MQSGGGPRHESRGQRTVSLSGITLQDLSRLLGGVSAGAGLSARLAADDEYEPMDDDDDDEETGEDAYYDSFRQSAQKHWFPPVTEPQKAGTELLTGGEFGRVANKLRSRKNNLNVTKFILNRTGRPHPSTLKEDYTGVRHSSVQSSELWLIQLIRTSYQTQMAQQSLLTMLIFILANSLQVNNVDILVLYSLNICLLLRFLVLLHLLPG